MTSCPPVVGVFVGLLSAVEAGGGPVGSADGTAVASFHDRRYVKVVVF